MNGSDGGLQDRMDLLFKRVKIGPLYPKYGTAVSCMLYPKLGVTVLCKLLPLDTPNSKASYVNNQHSDD